MAEMKIKRQHHQGEDFKMWHNLIRHYHNFNLHLGHLKYKEYGMGKEEHKHIQLFMSS